MADATRNFQHQVIIIQVVIGITPGANLINIQRLGLRRRLKKASTGMHRGLRLTVIFQFLKLELAAY